LYAAGRAKAAAAAAAAAAMGVTLQWILVILETENVHGHGAQTDCLADKSGGGVVVVVVFERWCCMQRVHVYACRRHRSGVVADSGVFLRRKTWTPILVSQ
jgi:hypothetical protein